jgi:uncharacterized protein YaiE (UPF0345 family)
LSDPDFQSPDRAWETHPLRDARDSAGRNATLPALASRRGARHDLAAMSYLPTQFAGVTVLTKANVYFDGKVVSHTLLLTDGSKKTVGLIYPGSYHFGTDAPERMEIVAGGCRVTLDGSGAARDYAAGTSFDIPGKTGFTIEVGAGLCEYICSFLK